MDEKIKEKIEQLRALGKEADELELWESLLPIMIETEKQELLLSLEKEVALMIAE